MTHTAYYVAAVTGWSAASLGSDRAGSPTRSWRRRSCSSRTLAGVWVTPRQPREARSSAAHTSDRQLVSPGRRPRLVAALVAVAKRSRAAGGLVDGGLAGCVVDVVEDLPERGLDLGLVGGGDLGEQV